MSAIYACPRNRGENRVGDNEDAFAGACGGDGKGASFRDAGAAFGGSINPRLSSQGFCTLLRLNLQSSFNLKVFRMSDTEEVTGSQAASKHKLVATITDPELAWVAPEPRGERICSSYIEGGFTMYEMAFKEMGYRLPFNNLEAEIFGRLKVAPSQLHPNALAFIRAYQVLCRYLEVEATVSLFFYIFKIQRQKVGDQQGWVSLKHATSKIFKMYVESARGFKERMGLPVGRAGGASNQVGPSFSIVVVVRAFCTANRRVSSGFEKLKVYLDGFKPCKVLNNLGEVALEKYGKPRIEPPFVNTKLLLSCKTVTAESTLLGRMADLASEL
ncbi:hypothetical protein L195_g027978, partial [Trifolium pratense]